MKAESPIQGNLTILATGKISRLLWDYSIPAVVGMLVMSLFNVIDRIFIGQQLGTDAISGLTITFPVMNISAALGVLVGAGASARTSILLGAGNVDGAKTTLGNALTLILINASIYIALMRLFLDNILIAFGADNASRPYAHDFMAWILPGMLVMNIGFSLNNVMRASGYPQKAMIAMFIGAGLNVALCPLFIFILNWGIKGAAIATDISMTIVTIYVLQHFCSRRHTIYFKRGSFRLRRATVLAIIGIGAAPSVVNIASCFINVIINNKLHFYGGNEAIAAAGIFVTYTSLLCMVIVGLCQGMQPIVGYNYGAGNLHRLRSTYLLTVAWASIVAICGSIIGMTFPHIIAELFGADNSLTSVVSHAFRLAMLCFAVVGFQIVSTTFFQSIGKIGKSIILSLSRQVLFLIPLLLLLTQWWGLNGVWLSFPISDLFATLVTAVLIWWQFRLFHTEKN